MERPVFIAKIRDWIRAGYPAGVPSSDFQPLLALLERQLTPDEVKDVTRELIAEATVTREGVTPVSRIDAGVAISGHTQELPRETDICRVRSRLEHKGWPFDDHPLRPAVENKPDNNDDPINGDSDNDSVGDSENDSVGNRDRDGEPGPIG